MLHPTNGTIVPKSVDSPALPPNFKVSPKQKRPIIAVVLRYPGSQEWEVIFMRGGKAAKSYNASLVPVALLCRVIYEYQLLDFVTISPKITGWVAYVDKAVYPPRQATKNPADRGAR